MAAKVQKAIEGDMNKLEKKKLVIEVTEASKDLLFLRDIEKCMHDFEGCDAEIERRVKDE